jgi:uncharacterized repeat protein (TIGR01451 family)
MSAPDRTSRQQLVLPPRTSSLPLAVGFVASGCLGFALVWATGIGRSPQPSVPAPVGGFDADEAAARAATAAGDEAAAESADFAPVARRSAFVDPALEPASLDVPEAVHPALDGQRPLSRFSGGAAESPAASPAAGTEIPSEADAARLDVAAAVPADPDGGAVPDGAVADGAVKAAPPGTLALPPDAELAPLVDAEGTTGDTSAASGTGAASADVEPAPLEAVTAAPLVPPAAAEADEPPTRPTAASPEPPTQPSASEPSPPSPRAFPPAFPPTGTADVEPRSSPPSPFAVAPPLVPGAGGPGGLDRAVADPLAPSAAAAAAGQGRPGPLQLEGIQTPQVSVEKRGPREIQVGKPARYEILVRNIGTATAHDVVLRDSVPYGTALVTTTPPAAPGQPGPAADASELVWHLGTLPPGGQARVVIELMPQAEGDVGSVASVTFRAEASVRSRATKPALQIACSEPDPVLIGRDAGLTITVTNPGTGVATGVVLEGFLPENVSHRSGSELEFDVGQLKPGESRTIELVLGTRGPGVHTARLAARADGGIEVQQAVRLEVTAPTLELAVDMPVRRFLQRPATCGISMVNAGTAPARAVELAAQLPPGMKFVRANNAGWYDDRTHRVLWNLEELPPGETGTVEVVVMPVQHGPQKILAAARSADGPADQVVHVCEVEGLAALFFEVADSEDPIEVEGLTEYVVRVGNQGTKPATGVRLTATLLGDLEPVEAQGPAGHRIDNLTVAFEPMAKLAPAEEAVFRVRARGRSQGDHRVQVQLVSEDHPTPITKEEITRVYDDR